MNSDQCSAYDQLPTCRQTRRPLRQTICLSVEDARCCVSRHVLEPDYPVERRECYQCAGWKKNCCFLSVWMALESAAVRAPRFVPQLHCLVTRSQIHQQPNMKL